MIDASTPEPHQLQPMFWPGSLNSRGYAALLDIAKSGAFRHMAISPLMVKDLIATGRRAADIRQQAEENGVALIELDGVSSWAPVRYGEDLPGPLKARFDVTIEECLDMAQALGLESILAVGAFDKGAVVPDALIESFAAFCDAAAARSLRVELEFVPFWGIPDLPAAWAIVEGAGRANGGILLDTWHFAKGSSDLERDFRLLDVLPPGCIANLQIADAPAGSPTGSLYAEGRLRCFPGDGVLDIARIVKAVQAKGGLRFIGPEIFGAAIDDLSNTEAAQRCHAAVVKTGEGL